MRIRFKRSGGFAGLQGPGQTVDLDSRQLPAEKARQLKELIARARFFDQPAEAPGKSPAPDGFQYDVSVEDEGRNHAVRLSDGALSPEVAPLVQWLVREARERK
jgi:hypothetical protein